MKTKMKPLVSNLLQALGAGVAVSVMTVPVALAQQQQDQPTQIERIVVTGSSISRAATEGALPVITLTTADIEKTGALSISDLIQMLPAMQGFVASTNSVNGGGVGGTTAALHALPTKYTLVLLDGQRVAPQQITATAGGGFGVNLESIPIDAVERVEILTDGASATYGSDAIAGVVNFILKKNTTEGVVYARGVSPQQSGGGSWSVGASKGWGNLDTDHWNVLATYSHDEQDRLEALQRPFSATGAYFPFSANGTNYIFNGRTSNTTPANITFNAVPNGSPAGTTPGTYAINPYYTANGNCGSPLAGVLTGAQIGSTTGGISCRFNYAALVEDIPGDVRDSALLKGAYKINDDTTVWGEYLYSLNKLTAQYAPSAQPLPLTPTQNGILFTNYVQPYLNANGLTYAGGGKMGFRTIALGGRTDDYQTEANHFAAGVNGKAMGWEYNASITLSKSVLKDFAAGGYSDFTTLNNAIASGAYDPIMNTGGAALQAAVLSGQQFQTFTSNLDTYHIGAQHDLWQLAGGMSIVALGAEYQQQHYQQAYDSYYLAQSGFSTQTPGGDYPVGGGYGQVPLDAKRDNWGAFAEVLLPVVKTVEVTASGRYDSYSTVHSSTVFSTAVDPVSGLQDQIGAADLGNTFSDTTGKLSVRWTPIQSLLVRGSYGSGFKAPNITDIAGALVFNGSTSGSYPCPFPGSSGCLPGSAQYDVLAGPNGLSGSAGLKPEKSNQWTVGVRWEPVKSVSLGADLWDVKITNQIESQGVAEQVGFANPNAYKGLFINPYQDPAGFTTIGYEEIPFNGGVAEYQGIDWDFSYVDNFPIGKLNAHWTGTYMIKQQYNFGPGQPFNTDLGVYGPDQGVVFRVQSNLIASLQTGAWLNTLFVHYKSGYKDEAYPAGTDIFLAGPGGTLGATTAFSGLNVPSYTTVDIMSKYNFNKRMQLTVGIKNLFNQNPPLTLQTGGAGNAVGYDGRYADPIGRALYLYGSYKF